MDLRQLRYFVTLAETLNFRRAAARLNLSQPPLTVAIRKLEAEVGTPLFVRGSRGATLTAAGEAALGFARGALAQAEQLRIAAHDNVSGARGRLRIGFVGSAIYALLPQLIPAFRTRYPAVELILEESTSAEIARRLRTRDLDVGLIRLPLVESAKLEVVGIQGDELHVALPAAHALAEAGHIELGSLAQERFIVHTQVSILRAVTLLACHEAGFAPEIAQEAAQVPTILSLVQSGLGVALVPSMTQRMLPGAVVLVPLDKSVKIETGVALPQDSDCAAARHFADIAIGCDSD